jgi:hypothetical protein
MTYHQYGTQITSATITVTTRPGATLSGLTIGQLYALNSTGGPWHAPFGTFYQLQLESGGTQVGYVNLDTLGDAIGTIPAGHSQLFFQATATSVTLSVADGGGPFSDNTGSLDCALFYAYDDAAVTYCAYGSGPQSGTTTGIIITTSIIDLVVTFIGAPWLAIVFDAFIGKIVYTGDLCGGSPPPMPTFTNDDFIGGTPGIPNPGSLGKFWQALQATMWPYFCECTAGPSGSTPPVPFPTPSPTAPPAAPSGPINIGCDDQDLCTSLNALARQLTAMSGQVAQLRSDVTLIQRQEVPFAYVPGPSFTGLTGSGTLTVQGILGANVAISSSPSWMTSTMAPVASVWKYGEIAFGTSDGWLRRDVITHNPHLLLRVSGAVTRLAYTFEPGVTASIETLLREP